MSHVDPPPDARGLGRLGTLLSVVHRTRELRSVALSYLFFCSAETGIWIALLVYAESRGGASLALTMTLVQLVPSAIFAAFVGPLVDHLGATRVLRLGYGAQAVSMWAVAAVVLAGGPVAAVLWLAPLTTLGISTTRPAQAALYPSIVLRAEELAAANVLSGWSDSAGYLLGPGLVGLVVAVGNDGAALMTMAVFTSLAWALSSTTWRRAPAPPGGAAAFSGVIASLGSDLRRTVASPPTRVLLLLHTFYFVLVGSLDFLCVILAVNLLRSGGAVAGYLNGTVGAGGLLGAVVALSIVGRRRLSPVLLSAVVVAFASLAVLAVFTSEPSAFVFIGLAGAAGALFDLTARTLLQRSAPPDAVASCFAVLESLLNVGLALGVLLVRGAIALGGARLALVAPGALGLVCVVVLWGAIRRIDDLAPVPHVEISLLRSSPLFSGLSGPATAALARCLVREERRAGETVVAEGDAGESYYLVASGSLVVTRGGTMLRRLVRGDAFGEVALLRNVPRTATVTTIEPSLLYAVEAGPFVLALTGHAPGARRADALMAGYLGGETSG